MKRLQSLATPAVLASTLLPTLLACSSTSVSPVRCTLAEQRRGLRNLHQYPHARYKSLVKDCHRFSRNWWLTAGNNHELVSEVGHEREATENLGIYRDDSQKDVYLFSTNRLADLPPSKRLDAIVSIMQERWKVRDGSRGFDKAKLLLQALECFSEMRLTAQIKPFKELPTADQDTFLQYVEGCLQFAQACSHSHPDAVAIMIRAAQICDELRCDEKREEALQVAERAARCMDRAYSFSRPLEASVPLNPPTISEVHSAMCTKQHMALKERFKNQPSVLEPKARLEFIRGARNKKIFFSPMRHNDFHHRLLDAPHRPETAARMARE